MQVQALVGFEKTIKHLDDHLVDIGTKVNSYHAVLRALQFHIGYPIILVMNVFLMFVTPQGITKPKEVRKIKGEGMPLHFSNKKGDLYVNFEVLFPTSLTEDQKKQIKEILG